MDDVFNDRGFEATPLNVEQTHKTSYSITASVGTGRFLDDFVHLTHTHIVGKLPKGVVTPFRS